MAIKRLFSDWNKEELEATFGLTRCRTVTVFDEWLALSATQHVDELEETLLIRLRDVLLAKNSSCSVLKTQKCPELTVGAHAQSVSCCET